jgi:hypothetical protein
MSELFHHIERYRTKADQFRTVAHSASDAETRQRYLEAARCCDNLARDAEREAAIGMSSPETEKPQ